MVRDERRQSPMPAYASVGSLVLSASFRPPRHQRLNIALIFLLGAVGSTDL